jgi:hypothetical protein
MTYNDSSKICRSCGAILEEVAGESPSPLAMRLDEREQLELIAEQALSSVDQAPKDRLQVKYAWTCSECAERVPGTFDICWNCGTDRNGVVAPRNLEADANTEAIDSPPPRQGDSAKVGVEPRCTVCGSTKVVPNVQVLDQGQHSGGTLQVVIYGDPDAIIFKDRLWGKIRADICGQCGHVQLRVNNFNELYDHYLNSIGGAS